MTDDELRLMLDWRPSQIPFEQLPAEWKAWATAMIESAEVPANKHAHMRPEDSVLYLCRVLRVFKDLGGGMTEDDLRGKFVSGLVLSGLPPERDYSFCFGQALPAAERRGLVSHEDHGWGREQVRLYDLTVAGDRLATDVDPVQWTSLGGGGLEPTTADCDPQSRDEAAEVKESDVATHAVATRQEMAPGDDDRDTAHAVDFRSVKWFGQGHVFTATQAACIKVLWEHWEQGTPAVGEQTILELAGAGGERLRDVFDKGKHPAWNSMIIEARKGAFRLQQLNSKKS